MRIHHVTMLLAGFVSTPALAQGETYIGIDAGTTIATSQKIDTVEPFGTVNEAKLNEKAGIDLAIVVGRRFGMFRLEGELAWKRYSHKSVQDLDNGAVGALGGNTTNLSFMANGLLAVPTGPVTLIAGPGIGISHNRTKIEDADAGIIFKRSDDNFAWQLQAGAEFAVTPKVQIALKYRYFETKMKFDDADINPDDTNTYHLKPHSHSLLAGIRYNF